MELLEKKVPHIPRIIYAGEVPEQPPRCQTKLGSALEHFTLTPHLEATFRGEERTVSQARMPIVQEIAYPLRYVQNSKQLVRAIFNVLESEHFRILIL